MPVDAKGFDRDFYLAKNPDVASAGVDPYTHYLQHGWREGRDPNAIFDTSYYLSVNRDIAAAGIDLLAHYISDGWREGRDPSIAFDTSDYLSANADVAAARMNPMLHYLLHGQSEHRALTRDFTGQLREGFDRAYYLSANPDVKNAGVDPYLHYQQFGYDEGRNPNAFFDKAFYLAHNPDVASAGVDAFQHFLTYGWHEGRDPSADFSLSEYRAATGTPTTENALLRYLVNDRYSTWLGDFNAPHVIQARGSQLDTIFVGKASFELDGALTHVSAPFSALDGHDLSGFTSYNLSRSIADITISGTGRLPLYIELGRGDDRISGSFDLSGQILNIFAGAGTLTVDVQLDNGLASINGGSSGSDVIVRGSATVHFTGAAGADVVMLGAGDDYLSGGMGINYLNGGAGKDTAAWTAQVRADLLTGRAISLGGGASFEDALVSIENLGGSAFNDILLGDDGANTLSGAHFSPGGSGDDILAGRGGNDTLWGMDGTDILIGGRGADSLFGEEGDDLLIDAADGWGASLYQPVAYGGAGNDRLVYLLGGAGDAARGNFMAGGTGSDTYIVDASQGYWGSLGLEFSQIDGDKLDLSALRTRAGGTVTLDYVRAAASTPFYGSTTIDLSAFHDASGNGLEGRLVLNGVFSPTDLRTSDFVYQFGQDWRAGVPVDLIGLI